ncbi:glycosyltransferase, partial [Arthrospira platensis SPKY1]|nr:glycosyltransferase [Arthrospira platensis SPKY1]
IGPVDKSDRKKFHSIINEPFFKDRIRHYKWKDISLLPSYLHISDIAISPLIKNPQHESGIANKVFQYMLFETPTIVSDCKPQADLIKNENAGLVFKSDSVEDLAEKIIQLLQDRNLLDKMGLNGKNAVLEKYNTEITGNQLLK